MHGSPRWRSEVPRIPDRLQFSDGGPSIWAAFSFVSKRGKGHYVPDRALRYSRLRGHPVPGRDLTPLQSMEENKIVLIWEHFVEFLAAALFALAQAYGGNLGLAIITLSFAARIALLPFTLRLARRTQERQAKFLALQPEIRKLRARYGSDPQRLNAELLVLFRRHGYSPLDGRGLLGGLAQLPVGAGLYTAISHGLGEGGRFLWITNLARPDVILALLTGVLTYLASILSPDLPQQARIVATFVPALLTVYFVWNLASGVGLYWATSTAVGVLQSALMRRSSE